MADNPRQQQPFANMSDVPQYVPGKGPDGKLTPAGKQTGKVSQAQLALQGLVGAK